MKPIEVAVNLMLRTANKSPPLYSLKLGQRFVYTLLCYVKPQTGIYEYLLATHKLNPKECLFIDDQEENVNAAQELDIPAWQFQENHVNDLEEYLKQMYLI